MSRHNDINSEAIAAAEQASLQTRRATLARLGIAAGGAAAASSLVTSRAQAAQTSSIYIVVDPAGGGDFTSLETAVKNAPSEATIFVKRGLHVIGARMFPKEGQRFLGEGYGSHIQAKNGLNDNVFLIFNDNVVFENLRIDGNGANQNAGSGSIVNFQSSNNGMCLNCWVHDSPGYNIVAFPGANQVSFIGNRSYNSLQEGIELQGSSDSVIVGNIATNNLVGYNLWNSTGVCAGNTVVGNVAKSSKLDGFIIQDGAHDNTISGNTADGNGRDGFFVGNGGSGTINPANGNSLTGNTALNNKNSGFRLNGVSATVLADNIARNNSQHGVRAAWFSDSSVSGNVAGSNGGCGIRLEGPDSNPCDNVVITGNVCFNNGQDSSQPGDGISLYGTCRNVVVANNRCFDRQSTKTQKNGVSTQDLSSGPKNDNLLIGPNLLDGNSSAGLALSSDPAKVASPAVFRRLGITVGTSEVSVPHGLSYTPLSVTITMRSQGNVWMSSPPDSKNVYLTADAGSRQVDLLVG